MLIKKKYMLICCVVVSLIGIISTISLFVSGYNGNESNYVNILPAAYIACVFIYVIMVLINEMKSTILRKKLGVNLEELTNKIKKDEKRKTNYKISFIFGIVDIIYITVVFVLEFNSYITNFEILIGLLLFNFVFISWILYFSNLIFQMQYKIINDEYIDKNIEL